LSLLSDFHSFGIDITKKPHTMKNTIVAVLVGTIILFVFQAMSWIALPIHKNSLKYVPQQDSIMAYLSHQLPEDGMYGLPTSPPGATHKEAEDLMKKSEGKPWGTLSYHTKMHEDEASNMIIGFLINLFAMLIVVMLLNKTAGIYTTFGSKFMVVMGFSLFTVCQAHLLDWNWWSTPMHFISGQIIDTLLGWALAGLWLGWYLSRSKMAGR
jgi:riboflavin transporter FmnP